VRVCVCVFVCVQHDLKSAAELCLQRVQESEYAEASSSHCIRTSNQ